MKQRRRRDPLERLWAKVEIRGADECWRVSHTIAEDPEPDAFNVITTAHDRYRKILWPRGSTVLDPCGIIEDQDGVTVRRIGRR